MVSLHDCPVLTEWHSDWSTVHLPQSSAFIFSQSSEERSVHPLDWQIAMEASANAKFIQVVAEDNWTFEVKLGDGQLRMVSLRSFDQLTGLIAALASSSITIDMTGLSHHIWAPLLRACMSAKVPTSVLYVEPAEYSFSSTPTEGDIFDLSVRIRGISPIPGFASLKEHTSEDVCYVPLLGFEGARLLYFLNTVEPPGRKVYPIIGVPGFRPEYPFHAYLGNKVPLQDHRPLKNIRFARANCPFSLFQALEAIAADHRDEVLMVAPIGTKPHGLGAIMFAIANPDSVEVVYDHPIRKPGRTRGRDHILVYDVSAVMA